MILLGGRNYRRFFESQNVVYTFSTHELYTNDIEFPIFEDVVILMASMNLGQRYGKNSSNISDSMLIKNLHKLKDKKIIFISSSAVYGFSEKPVAFSTSSSLLGSGAYAIEKIKLEQLLAKITQRLIVLRPSGFFGGVCGFKPKSFLNDLNENILQKKNKIYDIEFSGKQLRDFTHTIDLMKCVTHFCNADVSSAKYLNISSTDPVKIVSVTDKISKLSEKISFNYLVNEQKNIHCYLETSEEIKKLIPHKRNIFEFLGLN